MTSFVAGRWAGKSTKTHGRLRLFGALPVPVYSGIILPPDVGLRLPELQKILRRIFL